MSISHVLFGFSGRATRFHFWMGQVAAIALLVVLAIAGALALHGLKTATTVPDMLQSLGFMTLVLLAVLVVLTWVSWAVAIKRLHDRNKSWVWMLITVIPAVMLMWVGLTQGIAALAKFQSSTMFVLFQLATTGWYLIELGFLKGTPGGNMYGPAPYGTGVFSPEFDELLAGEGYDLQAKKSFDVSAPASTSAPIAVRNPPVAAAVRASRTGAVTRAGSFGRRNARA